MEQNYIGSELMLFQNATTWKKYFESKLKPYIFGNVLEVGAGLGGTTPYLHNDNVDQWTCLEPDPKLATFIKEKLSTGRLPNNCKVFTGTIDDIRDDFNTILYIDVIEHIENDRKELERAYQKLKYGGYLVILVPAFQIMYSEFDKAIGHYRRYTVNTLKAAVPNEMHLEKIAYLDSLGLVASIMNKLMLKQTSPSEKQILFWDRVIVPLSKLTDKLFFYQFGKSLIGIWRKS
jgi:2-polyprenyl-3-methyl-5-hydroxy-6-metoxy-1,4-benzoquinol methylase